MGSSVIGPVKLRAQIEQWRMARPFRITGFTFELIDVLVVSLEHEGRIGRGEAAGVYYKNDRPASMLAQIEHLRDGIEAGLSRADLQQLLPAGGARNALDCAMWDLEAKFSGKTVWQLTGIAPRPVRTAFTIGIEETPQRMAACAIEAAIYPILKVKVDSDRPVERVAAIRAVRPDAELVVDANQGWSFEQLVDAAPQLADLGVQLIEQPLPRGADSELEGYTSPVPLCADESCQDRSELDQAARRYQIINVKLDKAGGLTEALAHTRAIRTKGLDVLIGSMCGTSLAMAPGMVVAQGCRHVELDGQLLLARDRNPGLRCRNEEIAVPDPALWG
jgi:L-Ala-D/L-Glu epimerase